MSNWTFMERDERLARELQQALPPALFDAHVHLWRTDDLALPAPPLWLQGPREAGVAAWRSHVEHQVGEGRLCGGLMIPVPLVPPARIPDVNEHLFKQIAGDPLLKGLVLVAPQVAPDAYGPLLDNPQFAGFKPYHVFSDHRPTFTAPLSTYLPEWAWAMAHERGLVITLHIVRDAALADPDNQRELQHFCRQYPNARVILAHAARGFHSPNTVRGISSLRGLENVWFDTSGICEPAAYQAILDAFGPRRLMWGSDFPVSEIRGRCVTVGDGFAWLQPDSVLWEKTGPQGNPTLAGLESLRALQAATEALGLDAADRQDIYADNARRLFGIITESGVKTQAWACHTRERMPGGPRLPDKRPEALAPVPWPACFREARGCEAWDLDGRHYHDVSTRGIRSCLLGFRDPDVTRAVQRRIRLGSMGALDTPETVELADLLCGIHPWAEQVRLARGGNDVCAAAVRIARVTTGRSLVAVCSDSPLADPPPAWCGAAVTFPFNDRDAFQALLDNHGDRLAAIVMEPCRAQDPAPGFLELVRAGASRSGALLVFDEITTGWRLRHGGAHLGSGVFPDLAMFADTLGNGYPVAAVIGSRTAMAGAGRVDDGSADGGDGIGPAAALATLRRMREVDLPARLAGIGTRVLSLWTESGRRHGLPVQVGGFPCLPRFRFGHPQADVLQNLFTQGMFLRGFLADTGFFPALAHTEPVLDCYGEAVDKVFGEIAAQRGLYRL